MPWIEEYESGDVGHGTAGKSLCLNNVAVGLGGTGGWIDARRLIFGNGDDAWFISSYDKETGQKTRLKFPSSPNGPLDVEVTANTLCAGGGHYAVWSGAKDASRGLYSSTGLRLQAGGLLAMGPDGSCAYKPAYQADGPVLVREAAGQDWQLTPTAVRSVQLLGAGRAIWTEGISAVKVVNVPQPAFYASGGVWNAQAAFVAGAWWIAYYNGEKGVVLHPFASADRAYSIAPSGDAWHTIRALGLYVVRVAISRTEGEGPGDVWGYDVDVRSGACRPLPFGAQPQEPFVMPFMQMSEINPPHVEIPTFNFNHAVSTVVFKDPIGDSGAPAEILVNQNAQRRARPVFVADDSLIDGNWIGPLQGIYTEKRGDALAGVIKTATALKTRVMACHDSQAPWTLPEGLRAWDVVAIETYRYANETLDQALARWRRDAREMLARWAGACAVVPPYYCMGGTPGGDPPELWPVSAVLDMQRHLEEIVNLSSRIGIVAPFSYLRGNGIVAHDELMQSFRNLLAAAPHAPSLPPVPVTPPKPDPPKPTPKPLFTHKEGTPMIQEIDGKVVVLRAFKGYLIRPDNPGTGIWGTLDGKPSQWRGGIVDGANNADAKYHHRAKKMDDGRYTFTHVELDCLSGSDAGPYTPDINRQYYYKPTGNRDAGDLERYCVYDGNRNGAIQAQCEQKTDDKHPAGAGHDIFTSAFTVEVVG